MHVLHLTEEQIAALVDEAESKTIAHHVKACKAGDDGGEEGIVGSRLIRALGQWVLMSSLIVPDRLSGSTFFENAAFVDRQA